MVASNLRRAGCFIALFACMTILPLRAADNVPASFSPPGGLSPDSCPQFIVIGWDDNTYADGIEWFLSTFKDYKNPAGTGNPATHDGEPLGMSFYFIGNADANAAVLADRKLIVARGYEIGNHTFSHPDLMKQSFSLAQTVQEMTDCNNAIINDFGIAKADIWGFRTPYLSFSATTFQAVKQMGLVYECTMTQHQDIYKNEFVWPYTLDTGFAAGVIDGWVGTCATPGLWEIPVYTTSTDATTMWPPYTGFDSSILTQGIGSQFGQMLKNALDYRLVAGRNRAPLTIGLHTDTYSASNKDAATNYDPQLNLAGRQKAVVDFVTYALTFPAVRFVSAKQLIQWMRNPVPLGRKGTGVANQKTVTLQKVFAVNMVRPNVLQLTVPKAGVYTLRVCTVAGQTVIDNLPVRCAAGSNIIALGRNAFIPGAYVVKVDCTDIAGTAIFHKINY
jgi:peptidoglycan/xylan/chitin deacetylase (PgdA/CDA1 family)